MGKLKISTWNVNSIKARLPIFLDWLKVSDPDVVLIQEIKCIDNEFPYEEIGNVGYNIAVAGQKSYNGVAIISKFKIEDVVKSLPEHEAYTANELPDIEARYIEAVISVNGSAVRVASVYVPNGGSTEEVLDVRDSKRFQYKLKFFDRLRNYIKARLSLDEVMVVGGDYNVCVEDIDIYDPKNLEGRICFHIDERKKMRAILNDGFIDAFRALNKVDNGFTWWDYRAGSWQYNKGMRIDYILLSPLACDKVISCVSEEKGTRDQKKASDHCPVSVVLEL